MDPTSGVLFGVPIPSSSTSAGAKIQAAVDRAVRESEGNGMSKRGKEVTPWLLSRVKELTGGLSVEASGSSTWCLVEEGELMSEQTWP